MLSKKQKQITNGHCAHVKRLATELDSLDINDKIRLKGIKNSL